MWTRSPLWIYGVSLWQELVIDLGKIASEIILEIQATGTLTLHKIDI